MHTREALTAIANSKCYYIAKQEEDTFGYMPKGVFLSISLTDACHSPNTKFFLMASPPLLLHIFT